MSWSALLNNQWISRNDLQDAINTGHFTLKAGQSIPAGNRWVTRSEVETWTNAIVTNGASNQWPQKSWLMTTTTTTTASPVPSLNAFYTTNVYECDYQGFPSLVYKNPSDELIYSNPSYTTIANDCQYIDGNWIYKWSNPFAIDWLAYLPNVTNNATVNNYQFVNDGESVGGAFMLLYAPISWGGTYKITTTIQTTTNTSIMWKNQVQVGVAGAYLPNSNPYKAATVGAVDEITVSPQSGCQQLHISVDWQNGISGPQGTIRRQIVVTRMS